MAKRIIWIIVIAGGLIAAALIGLKYSGSRLLDRYSPPEVNITATSITNSGGFSDPVTIEKLIVDSLGKTRPVKYMIGYLATCTINKKDDGQPAALNEIKLNEPGPYTWSGDTVHVSVSHAETFTKRTVTQPSGLYKMHSGLDVSPLKFENNNWYFISFGDPKFIGVYVYVDKTGSIQQYAEYDTEFMK